MKVVEVIRDIAVLEEENKQYLNIINTLSDKDQRNFLYTKINSNNARIKTLKELEVEEFRCR